MIIEIKNIKIVFQHGLKKKFWYYSNFILRWCVTPKSKFLITETGHNNNYIPHKLKQGLVSAVSFGYTAFYRQQTL